MTASLDSILYIDDEPDMRLLAQLALENIGHIAVTACESGNEAMKILRERRPQAILLDVMMPDMDGPAVLAALQSDPAVAGIPVIFLTGRASPEHVDYLQGLGAIGVIAKPFNPATLASQVQAIWENR